LEKSKKDILTEFVRSSPRDSFARYGLAMEYVRLGENDQALENFRVLWELNPDYTAAYFQAGKLLARIGETEKARQILQQGVQSAARTGDQHAKSEIEATLADL
jgi:tetratricopeptide (TPR) repeat protein